MLSPHSVFVSGCFDLPHAGNVQFLESAARFGDLIVAIGSDRTITGLKGKPPVMDELERLCVVASLRMVKHALIATGTGVLDFAAELREFRPATFGVALPRRPRRRMARSAVRFFVAPRLRHCRFRRAGSAVRGTFGDGHEHPQNGTGAVGRPTTVRRSGRFGQAAVWRREPARQVADRRLARRAGHRAAGSKPSRLGRRVLAVTGGVGR